jgi:Protein of unknown function (DUF3592)
MGYLLIVLGAVLSGLSVLNASRVSATRNWTEVEGTVISSSIKFEWEYYTPEIVYEYSIGELKRTGTRVRPWLIKYNWSGPARRLCERYRPGEKVKVFVASGDASKSVLDVAPDSIALVLLIVIGVALVVSGTLLL